MTLSRLIILIGVLLVVGFVVSMREPVPGLYPASSLPVREKELWDINFR